MGRQADLVETVEKLQDEILFKPSRRERELKAKFWYLVGNDPFLDPKVLTSSANSVRTFLGANLPNWDTPGFQDWFLNREEYRVRIEYLFGLSLDAMEEILVNNDPKVQGARVQLIRALAELAGKVPHKQANIQITANTAIANRIEGMNKEELEKYLGNSPILTIDEKNT